MVYWNDCYNKLTINQNYKNQLLSVSGQILSFNQIKMFNLYTVRSMQLF